MWALVKRRQNLGVHVSPFGVIPKKNKPNKWRLILHLSTPGASVNDGIRKEQCSLSYVSVDQVVSHILELGRVTTLAKMDVQQAYRQMPVFPRDRLLLGMCWKGRVYVDKVLPFSLLVCTHVVHSNCRCPAMGYGEEWYNVVCHYIDDFLPWGHQPQGRAEGICL